MPRVRFAPSPTGFLHVGSARTFIFNWLYARHNAGTMVLRLDDTDVERNTEAGVTSIFDGLRWLDLGWDEEYRQSERLALHCQIADAIFQKGLAYRDFTPAHAGDSEKSGTPLPHRAKGGRDGDPAGQTWLFNPGMRDLPRAESDRRAASGEPFALRFRVPRGSGEQIRFTDAVYGPQIKAADDIEDFALLRSDGMPTYHLASCADDIDLHISHIIRGQDHLSNTFKHVLIFEAAGEAAQSAGAELPQFAHLPLLVAPDGSKLSKRRHGPVVSVTTYRDAGFLPEAFINFLCLLGWSPKDDRTHMTRQELIDAFSLEGINRANAVVNFKESVETVSVGTEGVGTGLRPVQAGQSPATTHPEETFDPKALWLNAEHIRALPLPDLSARLLPVVQDAGLQITPEKMLAITPLIRERIKLLRDVLTAADFFFIDQLAPYDPAELIPQKGDAAMAAKVLARAREVLAHTEFTHDALDHALRAAAQELGLKAGQMFQPIRVAVCGRKNAPPLFETLAVLGKETTLERIEMGIQRIQYALPGEKAVVDHQDAAEVLESAWNDIPNDYLVPSEQLRDGIEKVMAAVAGAKSFKYLLVTGILAKAVQPDAHPRAIQAGSSLPGAYDARSLCHKVVVPFEKTRGNLFGLSNEPFVSKPLRHPEHDKSNPQLRNKRMSALLHDALEAVHVAPDSEVYAALVHSLRLGKQRADLTKAASIAGEQDLVASTRFVSEFLRTADGGARLVALWAAMLRLSDEKSDVRAYNPNQSDKYSGTIGDVEVFAEGELLSASECKHRPINLDDVEHGLAKNTVGAEYLFVIAAGFEENQEAAVRKRIAEAAVQGDVALVEAQREFMTMLKLMGPHRRRRLGSTVVDLLKEMREFDSADEAAAVWNKLLEQ